MPVVLPSRLTGVSPDMQAFLRQLVDAVNTLEPLLPGRDAAAADAQSTNVTLGELAKTVNTLQQQVNTLTPRAEEADEPVIPGQPGLPPTPTPGNPTPGGPALGIIGAGSAMPTVALPNLYDIVAGYANAHAAELAASCIDSGGNWSFMDGVVAALMAADPRVGYNGKRGDTSNPSQDAVSYYHGVMPPVAASPNVYVVDIIGGHCGPNPVPAWSNVTSAAARGAYMASR